jgi:hypothetical protein
MSFRRHPIYADDILLIARSTTGLQKMITAIENCLNWLDLSINCTKSCCMRIGKRGSTAHPLISYPEQVKLFVGSMKVFIL